MKKVLVTGHRGYIGAHLVALLKEQGHHVTGCEINFFPECQWEPVVQADAFLRGDFRMLTHDHLSSFDTIMHLAAISNDAMADLDPKITRGINLEGSVDLAKKAREAGVSRFLFAGSSSIYGQGSKSFLTEDDPLSPSTVYAESKIEAERRILELNNDHFCASSLRNATAYGFSPMFRIDLMVNNLLGCALTRGDVLVKSDGISWHPLIHCKDIARAFMAFAEAPQAVVGGKAVNIGANSENYQVKDILKKVSALLPQAKIVTTDEVDNNPHNYRVCFDLLNQLLPDFQLEYNLDRGIEELHKKYLEHQFSVDDFEGDSYIRLKIFKRKLFFLAVEQPLS